MRQNSKDSAPQPALPFNGPPAPEEPLLEDARWDLIKGCFTEAKPPRRRRARKGGRPALPARLCFEALLWHLSSGRPWAGLPGRFGSARTVQRRLDLWLRRGSLRTAWRRYLATAPDRARQEWDARLRARRGRKLGLWHWEMLGAAQAFVRNH